jgi:hypothetical protein
MESMKNMELRIEKSVYSFMSREGEEDSALRINEGKFKGTIYQYSNIILPKEDILDNAGHAREEYGDDWIELIGDILADQIDERIESGGLSLGNYVNDE